MVSNKASFYYFGRITELREASFPSLFCNFKLIMWKIAFAAAVAAVMTDVAEANHWRRSSYGYSRYRYNTTYYYPTYGYYNYYTFTYAYGDSKPASTTDTLFGGFRFLTSNRVNAPVQMKTMWSGLDASSTYALGIESSTTDPNT